MGNVRFFCKPRSGGHGADRADGAALADYDDLKRERRSSDTRFGTAADRLNQLESLTGHPVMTTLQEAERTGPIDHFDAMVIAPITASELNKLALGIYDTPVTLAAKVAAKAIRSRWYWGSRRMIFSEFPGSIHAVEAFIFFVPFGQGRLCAQAQQPGQSDWSLIEAALQGAL